jgi:uncharacterized lipoprotein YajG
VYQESERTLSSRSFFVEPASNPCQSSGLLRAVLSGAARGSTLYGMRRRRSATDALMTLGCTLVLGVVLSLLMTACVAVDQTVKLPEVRVSDQGVGKPSAGVVIVSPVTDQREIRDYIGVKKTAFGIPTAKIYPDRNVAVWLRERLKAELRTAGFDIARKGQPPSATVELALVRFFVEPVLGWDTEKFETDLAVRVKVTPPSGNSAEREYRTRGVAEGRTPSEKNYTPSLEQATAELMKRLVPDILDLAGRSSEAGPRALP